MSKPIVTAANHSTHEVFIAGDPNWDDQQLLINGQVATDVYTLATGQTATVSVAWDGAGDSSMMGVIFSQVKDYDGGRKFYQQEVGQVPETGNLGVTEESIFGPPAFRYALSNQTPWSMTMNFTDAS